MRSLALPLAIPRSSVASRVKALASQHAGIAALLATFLATAFIVPVFTPVATTDDWGYTRSVEILVRDGRLTVFPVVAATAVFQILWGGLFASIFGMSLGVMRLSTLVMTALGGAALYGLLGELEAPLRRRWLGVATYLFNPLSFMLAYTFMTDAHFTALMIGSTWLYVRGERRQEPRWTIGGSALASCAFLVRQQGALIPLAIVVYLVATRQVRIDRASVQKLLTVAAIPAVTFAGYYLWLFQVNDVPDVQQGFTDEARAAGFGGAWQLFRNLSYIELAYLGFFLLPLALAALPSIAPMLRRLSRGGTILLAGWLAVLGAGLWVHAMDHAWMPYIGQFAGTGGLGPPDVLGSRPRLLFEPQRILLTAICVAASALVAVGIAHGVRRTPEPSRSAAGIVAAIGAFQIAGVLPPSFHYLHRGYSLDRYLLPLLPLGIGLLLWSTRELEFQAGLGWLAIAAMAVVSIAGARDYLAYMGTVWNLAKYANSTGIANQHIDAGAAWDGYHLYTYGLDQGITKARTAKGPWWVYFYGKPTDSTFVVAGKQLTGYSVIANRSYSPWLGSDKQTVFLLRRIVVPGPFTPKPATQEPPP